jgi:hypothetical protein
VEEGGVVALLDPSGRKSNLKNRIAAATEKAVVEMAIENPALGQIRVSNQLRERGVFISPAGVRSVWVRLEVLALRDRGHMLPADRSSPAAYRLIKPVSL